MGVINTHNSLTYHLDNKLDKWLPYDDTKHKIINQEGLVFLNTINELYDYIFMDFYKAIDEDTLVEINHMVSAAHTRLKPGGTIWGWLDPHTPAEFYEEFEKIFDKR
jgi:spermidine synthase